MAAKKIDTALVDRLIAIAGQVAGQGEAPDGEQKVIKTSTHKDGSKSFIFFQTEDLKTLITVKVVIITSEMRATLEIYEGGKDLNLVESQAYKGEYLFSDGSSLDPFLHQLSLYLGKKVTEEGRNITYESK